MKINQIFDVFSRRNRKVEPLNNTLPIEFRNKLLLHCQNVFSNSGPYTYGGDYSKEFWEEIHQTFQYRLGRFQLSQGNMNSTIEDIFIFLTKCQDEEFLDFIEYIFKVRIFFHVSSQASDIISDINELFLSDNLGYELTDYIEREVNRPIENSPFSIRPGRTIEVASYPKVIKKESQFIFTNVTKPALSLLNDPKFDSANQEYLAALEDYKKGEYGDCLTKCGSCFESVMKVICECKKWNYRQTDTAANLLHNIVTNSKMEPFFEQSLLIIATLRNKLSTSHGAGVLQKQVKQNYANFALTSTANAIIFLINETK